jgi:CRISPR-associated endonuclease/helicase Cas3
MNGAELLFWAKTDQTGMDKEWTYPLWAHLLDVAHVAEILWKQYLPNSLKYRICQALQMDDDNAGHFLSFWVGLHDIGKAIPEFQQKHPYSWAILQKTQLKEGVSRNPSFVRHEHASCKILFDWLSRRQEFGAMYKTVF